MSTDSGEERREGDGKGEMRAGQVREERGREERVGDREAQQLPGDLGCTPD